MTTATLAKCGCGGLPNVFTAGAWRCWACVDTLKKATTPHVYDPVSGELVRPDPTAERIKFLEGLIVSF